MSVPPAIRTRLTVVLAVAVLGISSSAVLVRLMDASPIAITAWRCLIATALLSPALRHARGLSRRDLGWVAVGGVFLGLHFVTWIASLEHTTVLRSTVLVAMVPVWTGLLEWGVSKRMPPSNFWAGIGLALLGVGSMSAGGGGAGSWRGDALALLAGMLWSVYLLVGRDVRPRLHIGAYMCLLSGFASLTMWPLAWATGTAVWGFSASTWGLLLLAAIGPQLLGHQGFSYGVKYLPASTIAAIMLLEPVGSTALAAGVLGEWPPLSGVLGGLVVVYGVWVALRARRP